MSYYARRIKVGGEDKCQTMREHIVNTANRAKYCLELGTRGLSLESTGYLAGLLHDMGKYTEEFQRYLNGNGNRAIHSFQGCRYIIEKYHRENDIFSRYAAEIIAFAIGSHHGMFDFFDNRSGLYRRMNSAAITYDGAKINLNYDSAINRFQKDFDENDINAHWEKARKEIESIIKDIIDTSNLDCAVLEQDKCIMFKIGLLARLVLSAVIEGDRSDAFAFMRISPITKQHKDTTEIWTKQLDFIEQRLSEQKCNNSTDKENGEISDMCKEFAENKPGIYRLNVPIGTNTVLETSRYAIAHALKYKKRRIIFVSPYLSSLNRNGKNIRDYIADKELILEHYSDVIHMINNNDELDTHEILMQNWDSPIVVTSLFQFLNTLFDGSNNSIRRFWALCNSVIVIDEAQAVPTKMLTLFKLVIEFFSNQCGATVVLLSATQPFSYKSRSALGSKAVDIVTKGSTGEVDRSVLDHAEIRQIENMSMNEIAEWVREKMAETNSLLVVCNTRKEAADLFAKAKSEKCRCFHLSSNMCRQHRREVVNDIKQALSAKEKVLCVATQGLDLGDEISFSVVLRFIAGLDLIIKTAQYAKAGNMKERIGLLYIVDFSDGAYEVPREIRQGISATRLLLNNFNESKENYDNDLFSDKSIDEYYNILYGKLDEGALEYTICNAKGTGTFTLFDLMSLNTVGLPENPAKRYGFVMCQALKTAGENFSVYDSKMFDVLVPYGEGKEIIAELRNGEKILKKEFIEKIAAYTVSIYESKLESLRKINGITDECSGRVIVLKENLYDDQIGLL